MISQTYVYNSFTRPLKRENVRQFWLTNEIAIDYITYRLDTSLQEYRLI